MISQDRLRIDDMLEQCEPIDATLKITGEDITLDDETFCYQTKLPKDGDHRAYRLSNKERKTFKMLLFQADPHCFYCGRKLTIATATIDHVLPLSRGGDCRPSNLTLSCKTCNSRKGSKTPREWLHTNNEVIDVDSLRTQLHEIQKSVRVMQEIFSQLKGCKLIPVKQISFDEELEPVEPATVKD